MNMHRRTGSTESRGTQCPGVCGCEYWSKLQTIGVSVHVTQTWRPKMEEKHSKYKGRNRLHEWAIRKTNFIEIGDNVTKLTPTQTSLILSSVQFSHLVVSDSLWHPWPSARQAFLSITNSLSLLKFMSIESVMPSNQLILCCPLLLPPSIFPSIRVFFKWVSSSHQVVKVLEFQFQKQTFQWIFRTDFL